MATLNPVFFAITWQIFLQFISLYIDFRSQLTPIVNLFVKSDPDIDVKCYSISVSVGIDIHWFYEIGPGVFTP